MKIVVDLDDVLRPTTKKALELYNELYNPMHKDVKYNEINTPEYFKFLFGSEEDNKKFWKKHAYDFEMLAPYCGVKDRLRELKQRNHIVIATAQYQFTGSQKLSTDPLSFC